MTVLFFACQLVSFNNFVTIFCGFAFSQDAHLFREFKIKSKALSCCYYLCFKGVEYGADLEKNRTSGHRIIPLSVPHTTQILPAKLAKTNKKTKLQNRDILVSQP